MLKFRIVPSTQLAKKLGAKKRELAQVLLRQTQQRLRNGGDEEYRFPPLDYPRVDGSRANPLYKTGKHIYNNLKASVEGNNVTLVCNFIGARVHQFGTTGKGGLLPPIRPVTASKLVFPIFAGRKKVGKKKSGFRMKATTRLIAVDEVNIRPRKFLRFSKKNIAEIRKLMKG